MIKELRQKKKKKKKYDEDLDCDKMSRNLPKHHIQYLINGNCFVDLNSEYVRYFLRDPNMAYTTYTYMIKNVK